MTFFRISRQNAEYRSLFIHFSFIVSFKLKRSTKYFAINVYWAIEGDTPHWESFTLSYVCYEIALKVHISHSTGLFIFVFFPLISRSTYSFCDLCVSWFFDIGNFLYYDAKNKAIITMAILYSFFFLLSSILQAIAQTAKV